MTAHNHDRYVHGCYRCELGDDELAYAEDETLAECRELAERLRMEAKEAEASARTADPVDTLWWDAAERLDDLVDWVERLRAGPNRRPAMTEETCICLELHVGLDATGSRNWNPDCPAHGTESSWWQSPEQVAQRQAHSDRLREISAAARRARKESPPW